MYEFIMQLREHYLQRIVTELRNTARPLIAKTFDEIEPLEIEGILVHPCVNVEGGTVSVALLPGTDEIELLLEAAEIQLKVENEVGDEQSLHEMRGDVRIALTPEGRVADDRVQIGVDATALTSDRITVTIATGHPLADDATLLELMNRLAHQAYVDGTIPANQFIEGADAGPFTIDAYIRTENDVGGDIARTIRVTNAPGADMFMLIVPIEVWANLTLDVTDTVVQHVQFTAELQTTFHVVRQLDNAPAFVDLLISQGTMDLANIVAIEGEDILDDPMARAALEEFVRDHGGELLAGLGDPRIDTYTMDQITALIRNLIRDYLQSDGRFIEFWGSPQSSELQNATPKVLDGILAIGINAGPNANADDIEPFLPDNRDFAVELSPDFFLEQMNAFLTSPAEYDDVRGTLRSNTQIEGSTTITVTGFEAETGTVRQGTRFTLAGSTYTVAADAEISANAADLSITPGLLEFIGADNDRVRIQFGFGLPLTIDAGGNDRTARLNDLTPSLQDGHIRLNGSFRVHRPHAVVRRLRNIDGTVTLRLGLDWTGTGRVFGGGQTGNSLDIGGLPDTLRTIRRHSLIVVDDISDPFQLTDDAIVEHSAMPFDPVQSAFGNRAELAITPALPESPNHGAMVLLRWRTIGRVDGAQQTGNNLRVDGITDGEDLIPEGSRLRVGGEVFTLDSDAVIENGSASIALTTSLGSEIEGGPAEGANVRFFGGFSGKAVVDGADQTGTTLEVTDLVRFVPNGSILSIDGLNGLFTVVGDTDIVGNAAEFTLRHSAVETLAALSSEVDTGDLWGPLGQPGDDTVVRLRSGSQDVLPTMPGDPDVDLDTAVEGLVGILIGLFVTIFTGGIGGLLIGAIAGIASVFILRLIAKDEIASQFGNNLVGVPLPDALENLDIGVDSYFNNPIEIRSSGILIAGSALPMTSFPDVAESHARANGPYDFDAGLMAHFHGGQAAPNTEYLWLAGDGALLASLAPSHTYPRRGFYVADLSSVDSQWVVEIRTRHLAAVRVHNSIPELGPLPVIVGQEGEEIELTVSFTDVAWTDTHSALVDFGDGSLPVEAEITEVNQPPATTGQLTARHTYCDNGTFMVTVILVDAQGGTDRQITEARIANVPPVVEAGEDMFAHPCTPLRLIGYFEDQGWCDTHTGTWDFGDCSPPFPATIIETNQPPKAVGHAIATHCYTKCGTFLATLTIRDDDGAATSDILVVRYSDLLNGDFEDGFQHHPMGMLGNGWEGYGIPLTSTLQRGDVFRCEDCVVCSGARAQAVVASGFVHAGLRQSLGVNPGWEYQFVIDVSVPVAPATVWLGIDPLGGTVRTAAQVVWSKLEARAGWQRLSNRAVAEGSTLTVFLEVRDPGNQPVIFDCITMKAFPCAMKEKPEERPDPVRRCISWQAIDPIPILPAEIEQEGCTFRTLSGANLEVVTFGVPQGDTKLRIPDRNGIPDVLDGLRIAWEGLADRITAQVSGPPGSAISLVALDADGGVIETVTGTEEGVRTLTLSTPGIAGAEIHSDHRGTLLEFCIGQGIDRQL